jgi:hypothetical protein
MFPAMLAAVIGMVLWVQFGRGSRQAAAVGWAAILVLPTWMNRAMPGVHLNFQLGVGLTMVACLLAQPGKRRLRWNMIDTLVVLYIGTVFTSLSIHEGEHISNLITIASDWILPYIVARLAYQSAEDNDRFVSAGALAVMVLAAWATIEAITRLNPVGALAGRSTWYVENSIRFGLKRAEGPTTHPIYFGMLLVMLLPWSLDAARRARHGLGPSWWRYVPYGNILAVLATNSRGPIIATLIALFGYALLRWPKRRWLLVTTAVLAVAGVMTAQSLVMETLHAWGHDTATEGTYIIINGKPYSYTGTNYRLLLFEVYETTVLKAGLLGYGRFDAKKLLPPGVPAYFYSIDNHYLYTVLTAGFLGLGSFLLLGLAVVRRAARASLVRPEEDLARMMSATIAAVLLMTSTVWFANDYAFHWFFSAGLAASWPVRVPSMGSAIAILAPRRLNPGHPVPIAPREEQSSTGSIDSPPAPHEHP